MVEKVQRLKLKEPHFDRRPLIKKFVDEFASGEPISALLPFFDKKGILRCANCRFRVFMRLKKVKNARIPALKCSKDICGKWYEKKKAPDPRQRDIRSWLIRAGKITKRTTYKSSQQPIIIKIQ